MHREGFFYGTLSTRQLHFVEGVAEVEVATIDSHCLNVNYQNTKGGVIIIISKSDPPFVHPGAKM